jgi:transglutaminase superfamily protein
MRPVRLTRLRSVSRTDVAIAVEAAALVPLVELGLRCWPLDRLVVRLGRVGPRRASGDAARAARIVDVVLALYPAATCLKKSLVLLRILRRRGRPALLRLGVRKSAHELLAHAWIECEGRTLLDDGIAHRYATLRRRSHVQRSMTSLTNPAASSSDWIAFG